MSNLSQFVGGSRYITDPRELPIMALPEAQLYVKTNINAQVACSNTNASTFFTSVAKKGAQMSVSVADTYVTAVDVTGRGRLHHIIPPCNTGAAYTPTVEVTVDGTVYTIAPTSTIGASNRVVIGAVVPGPANATSSTSYDTGHFFTPNSYLDPGYDAVSVGGLPSTATNVNLTAPLIIESFNLPFLQFEESLKVRYKTSLLASGTGDKIGGVGYRMLPA